MELLVAATITVGLAVVVAVLVRNLGATWTTTIERAGMDVAAERMLDELELDLQSALFRDDGHVWFAVDLLDRTDNSTLWALAENPKPPGAAGSLRLDTPDITDARFGQAGTWLRFFTNHRVTNDGTEGDTASAPIAVAYQLIRRSAGTAGDGRYFLHRTEVRPGIAVVGSGGRPGVVESGYNITGAAYGLDGYGAGENVPGDPCGIQTPKEAAPFDAVIAADVIDFGVRCYVRHRANALRLVFPADASGNPANSSAARLRVTMPSDTPPEFWTAGDPMPDVVDVAVRILTPEGVARIRQIERTPIPIASAFRKYGSSPAGWWWGLALEHSRVYTRRIALGRISR